MIPAALDARPVPPVVAATILADADLMERARPLLAAREDAIFHADALSGCRFDNGNSADCHSRNAQSSLTHAWRALGDAIGELRGKVASDHNLWDGVDPGDMPLMTLVQMDREYRRTM